MSLPIGKRPLRCIFAMPDPVDQLISATVLLEYVLCRLDGGRSVGSESLGTMVQRHAAHFRSIADVNYALGVRNDLVHTQDRGVPALGARSRPAVASGDVVRAAKYVTEAVARLASLLPDSRTRKAVHGSVLPILRSRLRGLALPLAATAVGYLAALLGQVSR